MRRVALGIRVMLAAVFVTAGIAKLGDPAGLAAAMNRFEVIPEVLLPWLARYVPWFEIVTGAALLLPWVFRGAWWLIATFMVVATLMLAQAYVRDLSIDCGCWGTWWEMPLGWALVRNAVLLALLVLIYRPSQRPTRPAPHPN